LFLVQLKVTVSGGHSGGAGVGSRVVSGVGVATANEDWMGALEGLAAELPQPARTSDGDINRENPKAHHF
jgi:hypothetical protein